MLRAGQLAAWPKLKFISNRMALEKVIRDAYAEYHPPTERGPDDQSPDRGRLRSMLSEDDLTGLLRKARANNGVVEVPESLFTPVEESSPPEFGKAPERHDSPSFTQRMTNFWGTPRRSADPSQAPPVDRTISGLQQGQSRRSSSVMDELVRQSRVFFDDDDFDTEPPSDVYNESEDERANGTEDADLTN
jgi:hypothetical protein